MTWIINHNLGYEPNVQIYTTGGVMVVGEVVQTSLNQTVINLTVAMAGRARLA